MTKSKLQLTILYALIAIFIGIIVVFVFQAVNDTIRLLFPLLAILGMTFLILGIALIIVVRKEKSKARLPLTITGIAAVSPLLFSVLHNLFYALAITFENIRWLFEALHVISFLLALVVAPITFLIAAVVSIILLRRESKL